MGRRRSSEDISKEEKELFHRNFRYMWDKLGTSYYYIISPQAESTEEERKNGINDDARLLPSYSVCSACYSGRADYYPSRDAVRRIVAFYNQWIRPEITVADFLNEDLSVTNDRRYRPGSKIDPRLYGIYCGYYYSQVSERMAGAYLSFYEEKDRHTSNRMKAVLISGFYSDKAMQSSVFTEKVLHDGRPDYKGFLSYLDSLDVDASEPDYYEGEVEMNDNALMILFRKQAKDYGRITMMINLESFPDIPKFSRPYTGGLAYVLSTENAGAFPAFYTFGFARMDDYDLSMNDPEYEKVLKIPNKPYLLRLRPQDDKKWIQHIRNKRKDRESAINE